MKCDVLNASIKASLQTFGFTELFFKAITVTGIRFNLVIFFLIYLKYTLDILTELSFWGSMTF